MYCQPESLEHFWYFHYKNWAIWWYLAPVIGVCENFCVQQKNIAFDSHRLVKKLHLQLNRWVRILNLELKLLWFPNNIGPNPKIADMKTIKR